MKVRDAIVELAKHDLDEECSFAAYFAEDIIKAFRDKGHYLTTSQAHRVLFDIGYESGSSYCDVIEKWDDILSSQPEISAC